MTEASVFEDIVEEEVQDVTEAVAEQEIVPYSTDPEWVNFLIGQLEDSELVKGAPTTDGLRRVTEKYFGEIISSESDIVSNNDGHYAIVRHTLMIKKHENDTTINVGACIDVNKVNLPAPFNKHLIATACTRAEGKALRRALKIRVHTAEELSNVHDEDDESDLANAHANDQQVMALTAMCKRQNIDLVKFVKSMTNNKKMKNIKQLQKKEASVMLDKVSHYMREGVPEDLVGYQANWTEKFGG